MKGKECNHLSDLQKDDFQETRIVVKIVFLKVSRKLYLILRVEIMNSRIPKTHMLCRVNTYTYTTSMTQQQQKIIPSPKTHIFISISMCLYLHTHVINFL